MRLNRLFSLILITLIFISFTTSIHADGFISPRTDVDLINSLQEADQRAAIYFEDGIETLIISVDVIGEPADFTWFVPLPSRPEVREVSSDFFKKIGKLTQPRVNWLDFITKLESGQLPKTLGGTTGVTLPQVNILEQKTVGVFDITIIETDDSTALTYWLKENGFQVPLDKKTLVTEHVNKGWFFVATKVNKDCLNQEINQVNPLAFIFPVEQPIFPLKISAKQVTKTGLLQETIQPWLDYYPELETVWGESVDLDANSRFQVLSDSFAENLVIQVLKNAKQGTPFNETGLDKLRDYNNLNPYQPEIKPHKWSEYYDIITGNYNGYASYLTNQEIIDDNTKESIATLWERYTEKEIKRLDWKLLEGSNEPSFDLVLYLISSQGFKSNYDRTSLFDLNVDHIHYANWHSPRKISSLGSFSEDKQPWVIPQNEVFLTKHYYYIEDCFSCISNDQMLTYGDIVFTPHLETTRVNAPMTKSDWISFWGKYGQRTWRRLNQIADFSLLFSFFIVGITLHLLAKILSRSKFSKTLSSVGQLCLYLTFIVFSFYLSRAEDILTQIWFSDKLLLQVGFQLAKPIIIFLLCLLLLSPIFKPVEFLSLWMKVKKIIFPKRKSFHHLQKKLNSDN